MFIQCQSARKQPSVQGAMLSACQSDGLPSPNEQDITIECRRLLLLSSPLKCLEVGFMVNICAGAQPVTVANECDVCTGTCRATHVSS